MPSPEYRSGRPNRKTEDLPDYWQAARYADEQLAGDAYAQARDTIFQTNCGLSVYRFQLAQIWHVAVLGNTPPAAVMDAVQTILATGEPISLPSDMLAFLNSRRLQA